MFLRGGLILGRWLDVKSLLSGDTLLNMLLMNMSKSSVCQMLMDNISSGDFGVMWNGDFGLMGTGDLGRMEIKDFYLMGIRDFSFTVRGKFGLMSIWDFSLMAIGDFSRMGIKHGCLTETEDFSVTEISEVGKVFLINFFPLISCTTSKSAVTEQLFSFALLKWVSVLTNCST